MDSRKLKIDPKFKKLIHPLQPREYRQLEENILKEGCRDPIVIWTDLILDGHNRFEICTKHNIPFSVVEMDFVCREEAIAWICSNQLGRRNICEETRRFLIGKQYEAERTASRIRNPHGYNQYTNRNAREHGGRSATAGKIAHENSIARGTVEKYAIYSKAIDTIEQKAPDIVPKILSGQYKISHKNIVELSKLPPREIRQVEQKIRTIQEPFVRYNETRNVIASTAEEEENAPSVKDMPEFDPDADVNTLALTIPSWSSSINRVHDTTDLSIISEDARNRLIRELYALLKCIQKMLTSMEEN